LRGTLGALRGTLGALRGTLGAVRGTLGALRGTLGALRGALAGDGLIRTGGDQCATVARESAAVVRTLFGPDPTCCAAGVFWACCS